ncbi:MAG: hypothetical protein AB7D39_20855 [Pseudodesulfovibrio sp.]|uniref:hypothetical protein n=1 Tax=Pseudodesulfovibrio sp. TaxID=2035812 RepID=UPI003D0CCDC1
MSDPFEQQDLVQYLQARGRLDTDVSPDAAAKVKSLSKATGVSEPVAQRNEGLLQEQEQAKQVQQLVETSPKVAKWLAKDGNFALAKDDLEALSRIEQRSRERGRTAGDMITGAGASLLRMTPRAASTLSRSAWQGFSMAAASVESAAKGANDALAVSPDIRATGLGLGSSRPLESVARGLKNFGLAQSEYLRKEVLDSDLLALPDELKGRLWDHPEYLLDPEWMIQNVGDAAGSMIPVVAAYMTGGPAAAGVVGGLMEAGDLYEDLERDPTVSTQNALLAAAGFGAATGVLNELGLEALVQKLPKGKLLSLAARIGQGLTEAGTEYAEEPAEAVARSLAHGRPEDIPGAVLESLKNVDVIPGSFLLGASGSVRRAVDLQQESDKAKRYADDQSKIGDLVKDSKLKQRSPEALAEVLEQTGFGEEAWITPEGVLALYGQADLSGQKGDELLQALGVDPKSAMSAMQLNQDIRVKTSDLHAHLTPEQFAELAQDLRSSPQAMTLRESGDEAMQARVREVAELAKREAQEETDYQAERERLRQEVLDTGKVDPEQADAWLSTLDGFASRWSGNGRDRADMLKMIRAAGSGVQAERSFHQPLDPSLIDSPVSFWIEPLQAKAANAAPTRVVASINDLPANVRDRAEPGDRGVFDETTGDVWLVADAIPDEKTAARTWLHEQSLHHGLRALIPDDTRRANVLFSVADHYGDEGLSDIAELYGLDLSNANDRLVAAEEKLAQLAERILTNDATLTTEERALWEKVLDAVRAWLRERLPVDISDHEVADLIRAAHRTVMDGEGKRYFQQTQTTIRGSLAVTDQGYLISLLQRADFSTVMHETGHFFLEEMGALIRSGQASESMVRDYALTRSWMATQAAGVLGELQAEVQQAKRAYNADKTEANRLALELAQAALDEVNGKGGESYIQAVAGRHGEAATSESGRTVRLLLHERFARAFERYLLEGKAPSMELKGVFTRFRRWLTNVYRNARALNVTLNADIRKVFDGLVQGEREVADAAVDSGLSDWSTDHLNALGVSGEDQAYVTRLLDTAKRKAEDRLHRAQVRGLRELRKQWRDETLHALESDALQLQVNELRKGQGLDRDAFIEMFGEEAAKGLPSGVLRKDGLDPEIWAYDNGYDSPDAAVNALWSWRSPKEIAAEAVEQREIEHRSQFRAEDFLVETDEYAAALEILSNYIQNGGPKGAQAQLEQRLQGKQGSRKSIARQAFRAYAKQVMGASSVADALRQDRYLSALRRAQDAERRAILRKDWAAAAKAGEQARFNLEMAGISGRMRQEVERGRRLVARTSRQKNLNSEPLRLVNEIARRFGLIAPAQGETLQQSVERYRSQWDTPVSLEDWTAAVSQEGYSAWFDPFVLDGRTQDYRKLSVDQFREVVDSVKQIKTVEHQRRTILTAAGRVALEQAEKELTDRALSTHKAKAPSRFRKTPVRDAFKGLLAIHTKMEALFNAMDGEDARGPWWTYMFRPLAEAESAKAKRMGEERGRLRAVFAKRFPSMKAMSKWAHKKFRIPEINDTLTGEQLHAIGLNMGNAYNREALKEGFGWNDAQLNAVLSKLEKADWDFIQSVWEYMDTFRPESFALEEEVTGRRPKRVEAEAVQTPFGEYAGGYYPIAFDPRLSFRAFSREQSEADKTLFGGRSYGSTQTRHGHLKERQGTGGQALRLEYAVIADHVFNTVHDLTFRRPVLEVGKLVRSKAVQEALESTVGREVHRELMPWLQDTAQERQEPMHAIHRAARWARKGTTVMSMGFKFTTMFSQVTGFLQTVETLGPKWSAVGLARVYGNPLRLPGVVREVFDKSPWMADRIRSYDRDLRDAMKGLKPVEGVKAEVQRMAFYGVGLFQMGVDLPTWVGAYEKAMAENGADEAASIAAADSAVRISQGSGQTKDLARVQRGGELMRLGTMFYSYFNTLYNLAYRRASRTKSLSDTPRAAASALLLWIAPAVLGEMLAGRGPDDDEEWMDWALPVVAQYPFQMIVGLRDIANAYFSGYGYEITPAQSAPESVIRWFNAVNKALEEEDPERLIKPTIEAAGYLFALPMNQAIITAGGIWDFMTDDPDAEVRDLFFRKRKGE